MYTCYVTGRTRVDAIQQGFTVNVYVLRDRKFGNSFIRPDAQDGTASHQDRLAHAWTTPMSRTVSLIEPFMLRLELKHYLTQFLDTSRHAGRRGAPSGQTGTYPLAAG